MKNIKENQIRKLLKNADIVNLLQEKYKKKLTGN